MYCISTVIVNGPMPTEAVQQMTLDLVNAYRVRAADFLRFQAPKGRTKICHTISTIATLENYSTNSTYSTSTTVLLTTVIDVAFD